VFDIGSYDVMSAIEKNTKPRIALPVRWGDLLYCRMLISIPFTNGLIDSVVDVVQTGTVRTPTAYMKPKVLVIFTVFVTHEVIYAAG
jgi:hypothetical protein